MFYNYLLSFFITLFFVMSDIVPLNEKWIEGVIVNEEDVFPTDENEDKGLATYTKNLEDLLTEFLKEQTSSHTKRAYWGDIRAFFVYAAIHTPFQLWNMNFWKMKTKVFAYLEFYKKPHKDQPDRLINWRTVNRKAYALSAFFKFLMDTYDYPKNPLKTYQNEGTPETTETKSLSERELLNVLHFMKENYELEENVLKRLMKQQQYLIFCFMALSLRRSEVVYARWSDLKREEKYITIFWKGAKFKDIPLPPIVFDTLIKFEKEKEKNWYKSAFIFSPFQNRTTNKYDKPLTTSYLYQIVKKVALKLWLEANHPHTFRTTFVKMALNKGLSDIEIMNSTGHSGSAMIKYYDTRSKSSINAINKLWFIFW